MNAWERHRERPKSIANSYRERYNEANLNGERNN